MATTNQELTEIEKASPYTEQIPFLGVDKRYYGFVSGTGAGKSFAGAYRLWQNADWLNPNSMGAIIVPDKSQFTDNIKPILEEFGIMDVWDYRGFRSDEPGLHTHNNERILILSADNSRQIGRIKGKSLAYIWMDEEAEIDSRARDIADQRLRVGRYPNLFITTTPDGKNHTYEFFVDNADTTKSQHGTATLYKTENKLAVVGVPPEANPAMRDEDIQAMRQNLPEQIVAQEIEGEFIEIGGGIFKRDMFSFVQRSDINEDHKLEYILGIDPATQADAQKARDSDSDFWAATLIAFHRSSQQIYVVDAKRKRGMTLSQGVNWIADIADQVPNPSLAVESNQSQRWLRQELADNGYSTINVQSTKDKEERLIDLSIPIENDQIKFINHSMDESLGYDPRWQTMLQEFLSFPEGSHDDQIDSLHLAVDNANISTNTILSADPYER